MSVLDILTYPNPTLRTKCRALDEKDIQAPHIQSFIQDMIETMYAHPGTVGLAASQLGYPVRIFVMDSTAKTTKDRLFVVINPEMPSQSQWKYSREGCLSFPDYLVTVKRARKVEAKWFNEKGESCTEQLKDFEAIIFQHETDHLDGILFIDRVKNIQSDLIYRTSLAE